MMDRESRVDLGVWCIELNLYDQKVRKANLLYVLCITRPYLGFPYLFPPFTRTYLYTYYPPLLYPSDFFTPHFFLSPSLPCPALSFPG